MQRQGRKPFWAEATFIKLTVRTEVFPILMGDSGDTILYKMFNDNDVGSTRRAIFFFSAAAVLVSTKKIHLDLSEVGFISGTDLTFDTTAFLSVILFVLLYLDIRLCFLARLSARDAVRHYNDELSDVLDRSKGLKTQMKESRLACEAFIEAAEICGDIVALNERCEAALQMIYTSLPENEKKKYVHVDFLESQIKPQLDKLKGVIGEEYVFNNGVVQKVEASKKAIELVKEYGGKIDALVENARQKVSDAQGVSRWEQAIFSNYVPLVASLPGLVACLLGVLVVPLELSVECCLIVVFLSAVVLWILPSFPGWLPEIYESQKGRPN